MISGSDMRGALTFDMRGGRKWAKPACGRPLDGRVRRLGLCLEGTKCHKRGYDGHDKPGGGPCLCRKFACCWKQGSAMPHEQIAPHDKEDCAPNGKARATRKT